MKAKIKKTGQIIDVYPVEGPINKEQMYKENDISCLYYYESALDFNDTIDWEQRRYEISKEMLPCIQRINSKVAFRTGKICSDKEIAETAIRFADELITQLKGE